MCLKIWNRDGHPQPTMSRFPGRKTGWAWATGTFFGAGLMKPGPGTWGSVAAVALWFSLAHWAGLKLLQLSLVTSAASLIALAIGIPAASIVERESGGTDPGHVVIDEVCGQWIALIACPVEWKHMLLALLLFRGFDIVKPWPARQLERLPRGWGIMFDDVAAGLYALLVVQIASRWI
jgi:phosphatidylglycerophosphatase A